MDCAKKKIPQICVGMNIVDFAKPAASPAKFGCMKLNNRIVKEEVIDSTIKILAMMSKKFCTIEAEPLNNNHIKNAPKEISQNRP